MYICIVTPRVSFGLGRSPVTLWETSSRHGTDMNRCNSFHNDPNDYPHFYPILSIIYEAVAKVCQGYVFRIGGGNDKQVLRAVKCPMNLDKYG